MTKSEYFEKNNVSFANVMKAFNGSRYSSFDEFLRSKYNPFKFKVGDIVVLQLNDETRNYHWHHNVVLEVISCNCSNSSYSMRFLTPHDDISVGSTRPLPNEFVDNFCEYY